MRGILAYEVLATDVAHLVATCPRRYEVASGTLHCTMLFKCSEEAAHQFLVAHGLELGHPLIAVVTAVAHHDGLGIQALRLGGVPSANAHAHLTYSRREGVVPKLSNELLASPDRVETPYHLVIGGTVRWTPFKG